MNKVFHVLPVMSFIKIVNPLTIEAKETFRSNWNYYYTVKLGWLFWEINF